MGSTLGLLGRKVGMTRIFTDDGASVPVTVIEVGNNRVTQVKTVDTDGYTAVQLTFGDRRASRVAKAQAGHLAVAGVTAGTQTREFKVDPAKLEELKAGTSIAVDSVFAAGQKVDVTGTTIGKGYAGTIKRHHFRSGRASHGNSKSHNVPGSIGMAQDPGRVFPGKRMTGHLGDVQRTTQNLEIARVDVIRGLLLVKGAVPGARNGHVVVKPAVKAPAVKA
jgi:large subunit ribosomal protein L3